MAPIHGRVAKPKTKTPKVGAGKPAARQKKARCSKCTDTHFPPTGRNCNSSPPREDLTSTLSDDPETEREATTRASPHVSPVRAQAQPNGPLGPLASHFGIPEATIPTLDARFTGHSFQRAPTPLPSPGSEGRQGYRPPSPAGGNIQPPQQAHYGQAAHQGPGHYFGPPPYVSPLARASVTPAAVSKTAPPDIQEQLRAANRHIEQLQAAAGTRSGPSGTGAQNFHLPPPLNPTPPPHQHPSQPIPPPNAREVQYDKILSQVLETISDLQQQNVARTERENLRDNVDNHNVFSGRMDEGDSMVNMTQMSDRNIAQRSQQHRRAGEPAPPMPTGQYQNPEQRVNQRLASLGEQAAARRGGGQGVYNNNVPHYGTGQGCPPDLTQYNNYNDNQYNGGSSAEPARRISSGRDRTGNDGTTRIYIPWPNEHCLIGIERRKVKYDNLNQAQWQAGLLNILEMQRDPLIKRNMSAHIARLAQDVVDCGFAVAKGACAAVLIAIEEGRANWAEPDVIEDIRRDSVSRVYLDAAASARPSFTPGAFGGARPRSTRSSDGGANNGQQRSKSNNNKTHAVCKLYNNNTCSQSGDHTVGNIIYKHVCSHCRGNGKSYPHPESACQKKAGGGNS